MCEVTTGRTLMKNKLVKAFMAVALPAVLGACNGTLQTEDTPQVPDTSSPQTVIVPELLSPETPPRYKPKMVDTKSIDKKLLGWIEASSNVKTPHDFANVKDIWVTSVIDIAGNAQQSTGFDDIVYLGYSATQEFIEKNPTYTSDELIKNAIEAIWTKIPLKQSYTNTVNLHEQNKQALRLRPTPTVKKGVQQFKLMSPDIPVRYKPENISTSLMYKNIRHTLLLSSIEDSNEYNGFYDRFIERIKNSIEFNQSHSSFINSVKQIQKNYVQKTGFDDLFYLAYKGIENLKGNKQNFKSEDVIEAALDGILNTLDPHSDYMNKQETQMFIDSINSQFTGIGVRLVFEDNGARITNIINKEAEEKGFLKVGDLITHAGGTAYTDYKKENRHNFLKNIGGKEGTNAKLTIQREGREAPINVSITRKVIKEPTVESKVIDNVGYIKIAQFSTGTAAEFASAIQSLQHKDTSIDKFVIDLRNNGGGSLQGVIRIIDDLISEGLIVSKGDYEGNITKNYQANALDELIDSSDDIVVLVNEYSASASEIMAGALQDQGRATIIGTTTFGKGTVQKILDAPIQESLYKVTTNLYYLPDGISPQWVGVTPDIEAKIDFGKVIKYTSERALEGTLRNPAGDLANEIAKQSCNDNNIDTSTLTQDFLFAGKFVDTPLLCAIDHLNNTQKRTTMTPYKVDNPKVVFQTSTPQ